MQSRGAQWFGAAGHRCVLATRDRALERTGMNVETEGKEGTASRGGEKKRQQSLIRERVKKESMEGNAQYTMFQTQKCCSVP